MKEGWKSENEREVRSGRDGLDELPKDGIYADQAFHLDTASEKCGKKTRG
jgi:hypothetical protein